MRHPAEILSQMAHRRRTQEDMDVGEEPSLSPEPRAPAAVGKASFADQVGTILNLLGEIQVAQPELARDIRAIVSAVQKLAAKAMESATAEPSLPEPESTPAAEE